VPNDQNRFDTHFTPLDAFDDLDPKYAEIGPHFVKLPTGNYRVVYKAREPFVPSHIKPLRETAIPLQFSTRLQGSMPWRKTASTGKC